MTRFLRISVISGRCAGNNERLCAKNSVYEAGLEPGNARSVGKLNPLSYYGSFL